MALVLLLGGCAKELPGPRDFTISIAASPGAAMAPYGGSVQYQFGGRTLSVDLAGKGAQVVSVRADQLLSVRVHSAATNGWHSLTVQREQDIVFESGATPVAQPLAYHAPR